MRVLFIYPDLAGDVTHYTGVTSHGIAVLAAQLRRAGHEPVLLHVTAEPAREAFVDAVRAQAPGLVAFSSNSHYSRRLASWTAWAAETGAPVAVGGVHATLVPEEVIALPAVDYVCVGEGEGALVDLCDALAAGERPRGIGNLWIKGPDGIERNGQRPLVENLDDLADPDYGIFDFGNLYTVRRGQFPYIMSRGCAFRCTYCSVHALRDLSPHNVRFWRFLSPEGAARQLRRLIDRHHPAAPTVNFLDAILFPNKAWLRAFAPLYREHVGLPFACNMRADMIDEEVAGILADMGCTVVRFGVESGDEVMTREVLDRGLDVDDIRRAFAVLARHGIARWSYNIFGLPREDLRRALATVRLNAELAPDLALAFIFFPYPGTRLHTICEEEGYPAVREFDHYMMGVATDMPAFPPGDVLFLHRFFPRLVRLYARGRDWPAERRDRYWRRLDRILASPLLPRGTLAVAHDRYKRLRRAVGNRLVSRSPVLYRWLGGTDPV